MDTELMTVKIDRDAHSLAKAEAARQHKSLKDFLRDTIIFVTSIPPEKKETEASTH